MWPPSAAASFARSAGDATAATVVPAGGAPAAFCCFWYRRIMMSLMCVCSATQMSSPCLVSNWNTWRIPATRILKNTAWDELPNCMMSRSSAECRYSLGTGRKKWIPRLLMPRRMRPGRRPMGSSMRFTGKKMELP